MEKHWFKPRGYKHLDAPVGQKFASNVAALAYAAKHDWSPLVRFFKRTKRYKVSTGKTTFKNRPIMFASHRDACILSKYANDLTKLLDAYYAKSGIGKSVIAYRQLGRANYSFSSQAYKFALAKAPCSVLCFDVTGFFDNLNHTILKTNLKKIL